MIPFSLILSRVIIFSIIMTANISLVSCILVFTFYLNSTPATTFYHWCIFIHLVEISLLWCQLTFHFSTWSSTFHGVIGLFLFSFKGYIRSVGTLFKTNGLPSSFALIIKRLCDIFALVISHTFKLKLFHFPFFLPSLRHMHNRDLVSPLYRFS